MDIWTGWVDGNKENDIDKRNVLESNRASNTDASLERERGPTTKGECTKPRER